MLASRLSAVVRSPYPARGHQRPVIAVAEYRHGAGARPERILVERRAVAVRPVGAVAGQHGIDRPGGQFVNVPVGEAIALEPRLGQIGDEHVGLGRKPVHHLHALRILEVDADAALAAVVELETGRHVVLAVQFGVGAAIAIAFHRLDLDDIGPHVCHQCGATWGRQPTRYFQNPDSLQWCRHARYSREFSTSYYGAGRSLIARRPKSAGSFQWSRNCPAGN